MFECAKGKNGESTYGKVYSCFWSLTTWASNKNIFSASRFSGEQKHFLGKSTVFELKN